MVCTNDWCETSRQNQTKASRRSKSQINLPLDPEGHGPGRRSKSVGRCRVFFRSSCGGTLGAFAFIRDEDSNFARRRFDKRGTQNQPAFVSEHSVFPNTVQTCPADRIVSAFLVLAAIHTAFLPVCPGARRPGGTRLLRRPPRPRFPISSPTGTIFSYATDPLFMVEPLKSAPAPKLNNPT